MMSDDLKACPFCGGEAHIERGLCHFVDAQISCIDCFASGSNFDEAPTMGDEGYQHNKAEAITAWNTRAPATATVDLRERLTKLQSARQAFVDARNRMNAAIPDMGAPPEAKVAYDAYYKLDHEAERAMHREQCSFAIWATDNDAAALTTHSAEVGL